MILIFVTGCSSDKVKNEKTLYQTDIIRELVWAMEDGVLYLKFDEEIPDAETFDYEFEH